MAYKKANHRILKGESLKRLIKEAKGLLFYFDIPLERYYVKVEFDDPICWVTFTHRTNKAQIEIGNIFFDEKTGEILQAGHGYGCLVM